MPDISGTLAIFAVAAWARKEDGERRCAEAIDAYLLAVQGDRADRFKALADLQEAAQPLIADHPLSAWFTTVIEVRLAEITASMANAKSS